MSTKTVDIGKLPAGVNQKAKETDLPEGAATVIKNLDISADGKLRRRRGYERMVDTDRAHSLHHHNGATLAVVDNELVLVNTDTWALQPLRSGLGPAKMSYAGINGKTYYSNGTVRGRFDPVSGEHRAAWAPQTPGMVELSPAGGGLSPGIYHVTVTVVDADGVESGAPRPATIELTTPGGITVSNLPTLAGAREVRVYCSEVNGSNLFLELRIPAGSAPRVITSLSHGKELRTLYLDEMPPGTIMRQHNGRMYVVENNVIWYSEALLYGLTYLDRNYFPPFDAPITMVEPVAAGLFVSADKLYFVAGESVDSIAITTREGATTIPGSSLVLDGQLISKDLQGDVAYWQSSEGAVLGLPDGSVRNITQDKLEGVENAISAASAVLRTGGVDRILTAMEGGSPRDSFGASDSATIEVIKSTSQ